MRSHVEEVRNSLDKFPKTALKCTQYPVIGKVQIVFLIFTIVQDLSSHQTLQNEATWRDAWPHMYAPTTQHEGSIVA